MKSFLTILALCFTVSLAPVYAIVSTPSAAPAATSAASKKAQDLLDRVATKVAELTANLRRTYSGSVGSLGKTSLTITTPEGEKSISTNEATTYYRLKAGSRSETAFTGIKAGDDLVAIGTIDPQNGEMTAKQIILKIKRSNFVGTITAVNNGIVTLKELGGPQTQIDLNDATSLKKTTLAGKVSAATISNFALNSQIFVIAYADSQKPTDFLALKALLLVR